MKALLVLLGILALVGASKAPETARLGLEKPGEREGPRAAGRGLHKPSCPCPKHASGVGGTGGRGRSGWVSCWQAAGALSTAGGNLRPCRTLDPCAC